jgi:hypothetical protein
MSKLLIRIDKELFKDIQNNFWIKGIIKNININD